MSNLLFQSGEKVLFIGDSITDCGRPWRPRTTRERLCKKSNGVNHRKVSGARRIEYVNKGIGGDVVEGLEVRWDTDVIAEKPDWLSVKIGINNASRQLGAGIPNETYLPEWEACYRRILTRARDELGARLFMFETFILRKTFFNPVR